MSKELSVLLNYRAFVGKPFVLKESLRWFQMFGKFVPGFEEEGAESKLTFRLILYTYTYGPTDQQ